MNVDFYIKKGNTFPIITDTLLDENEQPLLFQVGDEVRFTLREARDGVIKVNQALGRVLNPDAVTTGDTDAGAVAYDWQPTDTDTPGVYDGEWHVVFAGGGIVQFPNDRNLTIVINDTLT